MSNRKSFTAQGLILKRSNVGEADRIVTLLTDEYGKMVCVAKGVRKINSSKRASLEPGNIIKAFFIRTKSLPLLTQAVLIDNSSQAKESLPKIRQLTQILEIFDKLCVEEEIEPEIYQIALKILDQISHQPSPNKIKGLLRQFLKLMGYQDPQLTAHQTIMDYVQEISEQKMKGFDYLKV